METVRIGIVGDFNPQFRSHHATVAALQHSSHALRITIKADWLPTAAMLGNGAASLISTYDGVWISAGSPYVSFQGALAAIRFAREADWPLLATCGGFQHVLIEAARNVLNIEDADSAEHGTSSQNVVITAMSCGLSGDAPGDPKMHGKDDLKIKQGTRLAEIMRASDAREEYFCNFEVNLAYLDRFTAAGYVFSAFDNAGVPRALELPDKRFFIATLFQPQLSSSIEAPHSLIKAFVNVSSVFRHRIKSKGAEFHARIG